MKKQFIFLLACFLTLSACSQVESTSERVENSYDDGFEDGYSSGYRDGKADAEDSMSFESYMGVDYYDGFACFLDDAFSDPETASKLFELCDEVGYYPSALIGDYCFDTSDWVVHRTNSECIQNANPEDVCPCLLYQCYSRSTIDQAIKENSFLGEKGITYCPICFEK